MILLLDTHTFLWFCWDDPNLSPAAKALLDDPAHKKFVSPATPWEVAVKVSTGKLSVGGPYRGFFPFHLNRTGFNYLPTTDDHLTTIAGLPFHHRDPFDRMIVAQALVENIPVVGVDAAFDAYGVTRLW